MNTEKTSYKESDKGFKKFIAATMVIGLGLMLSLMAITFLLWYRV